MPGSSFRFDADSVPEEWLFNTLQGDPMLVALVGLNTVTGAPQIYLGAAPETGVVEGEPPPPYLVYFNEGGGSDLTQTLVSRGSGGARLSWSESVWTVLVTGRIDAADTVRRLNGRVADLLDGLDGATLDGYVRSCTLERTVARPNELDAGVYWVTRGNQFRIAVQPRSVE